MIKLNLYIQEIFDFLNTCSIKNVYIEEQLRLEHQYQTGAVDTPVWENPYYLHLTGRYATSDTPIYITSLDRQDEFGNVITIPFNRFTMADHPRTLAIYSNQPSYIKKLCELHPTMTDYIRGTVSPVQVMSDTIVAPGAIPMVDIPDGLGGTLTVQLTHYTIAKYPAIYNTYGVSRGANPYYEELVSPLDDVMIEYINATLWPIDLHDTIVTCDHLTLLQYKPGILHTNEELSLVEHLRNWLTMIDARWSVGEFAYEEYYTGTQWALLWQHMALELLTKRYSNMRTTSVHPFHIWLYLESHGLGDYRSILSNKQQLWLYKNITYIEKNRGKLSNLRLLSENLLDEYNAILRSKSIIQDSTLSDRDCKTTPLVISELLDNTTTALQNSEDGTETIDELLNREYAEGLLPEYGESPSTVLTQQTQLTQNNDTTYFQTKIIEIMKRDKDRTFDNLYYRFIAETTIYKLYKERLNFQVEVMLPDNENTLTLTASEAVALLLYADYRALHPRVYVDGVVDTTPVLLNIPSKFRLSIPYREVYEPLYPKVYSRGAGTKHSVWSNTRTLLYRNITKDTHNNPVDYRKLAMYEDPIPGTQRDLMSGGSAFEYDTQGDMIPWTTGICGELFIPEAWELLPYIDSQFRWFKAHVMQSRGCSECTIHDSYATAYNSMSYRGVVEFELVPGYTTYDTWMQNNAQLKELVELWENKVNLEDLYDELGTNITRAMYQKENGGITGFTDSEYTKMKQLFIQLCSYNVTFIDAASGKDQTIIELSHLTNLQSDGVTSIDGTVDLKVDCTHAGITTKDWVIDIENSTIEGTHTSTNDVVYDQDIECDHIITSNFNWNFGFITPEISYPPYTNGRVYLKLNKVVWNDHTYECVLLTTGSEDPSNATHWTQL